MPSASRYAIADLWFCKRAKAAEAQYEDEMPGVEDAPEEGEVDSSAPVPNKIHIRGLDTLTTADIREWVKEHHTDEAFKRVEWIDDTSANLIFDDERAAVEALTALSTEQPAGAFDLRAAKGIAARPDTNLQLRQTMAADVKLPGAKDRSRFYLLNPEHDPDTRFPNGRKRRYQDDRGNGVHKKRRGDREMGGRRRNSEDGTPFNVNFYDDDAEVTESSDRAKNVDLFSRTGRGRRSSDNDKRLRQGRLYDRSASPAKDGDGRYGFDDQQPYRRAARRRSRTPPDLAESVLRRGATGGDKDDLFAGRSKSRALRDEIEDHGALLRGNGSKELFPDRAAPHRRTDAQDIDADEVASIRGMCLTKLRQEDVLTEKQVTMTLSIRANETCLPGSLTVLRGQDRREDMTRRSIENPMVSLYVEPVVLRTHL